MVNTKFTPAKILGLMFFALALNAHAAIIDASGSVAYNGCHQTQQDVSSLSLNCWPAQVPSFLDDYSGTLTLGGECGETYAIRCSANFTLSRDYYFSGTGTRSFWLGNFDMPTYEYGYASLSIDGVLYQANNGVYAQNIQLGMNHWLTLTVWMGLDTGSFTYDLTTPGILGYGYAQPALSQTSSTLAPEPGLMLLVAVVSGLLFFRRHSPCR